jgi:hypothetical protein
MASIILEGPFSLDQETIAATLLKRSPGSFVLGQWAEDGTFTPLVVGRSDRDIRQEIQHQMRLAEHCNGFQFRYAETPKEAFSQQCENYHACYDCETVDGPQAPSRPYHPSRPSHTDWLCPVCGRSFLE